MSDAPTNRAVRLAALARKLHEGQTDLQGAPYIDHLMAVAEAAGRDGGKSAYVVGLFHDAVEDGRITFPDLRKHLTDDELIAVGLLTRPEGVNYGDYILAVRDAPGSAGILARIVKTADLHHNLDRMTPELEERKPHLRRRYEIALETLDADRLVT